MAEAEHVIERRARILGQKMQHRADVLAGFIAPQGSRPPFTKQLENNTALKWWREHRYDPLGNRVLQNMRMADIAELDTALAQMADSEASGM